MESHDYVSSTCQQFLDGISGVKNFGLTLKHSQATHSKRYKDSTTDNGKYVTVIQRRFYETRKIS